MQMENVKLINGILPMEVIMVEISRNSLEDEDLYEHEGYFDTDNQVILYLLSLMHPEFDWQNGCEIYPLYNDGFQLRPEITQKIVIK